MNRTDRLVAMVLFLQGMCKAAEELQADPDLRNEFALKFYSENGKPADENDVKTETEIRPFVVPSASPRCSRCQAPC